VYVAASSIDLEVSSICIYIHLVLVCIYVMYANSVFVCLHVSVCVAASTIDLAASSVCLHIYMQCMDTRKYVVYGYT